MSNTADVGYETNGYTLREAIVEAKRCLNCKKPMCRTGCPISNNIPEFIDALSHGDLGKASMIIAQRSNLPAVCGRVCPHERQCEGSCILGRKGQGIKIGKLERFIADMDGELELVAPNVAKSQPGNIAVIGSGPAGLTVAGDLAKMGFKVTVFDSQPEAGGVLMYGIPEFRLPKQVVRREVKRIKKIPQGACGIFSTFNILFSDGRAAVGAARVVGGICKFCAAIGAFGKHLLFARRNVFVQYYRIALALVAFKKVFCKISTTLFTAPILAKGPKYLLLSLRFPRNFRNAGYSDSTSITR